MRKLNNSELDAVAGGRFPRSPWREESLSDWLDNVIANLTISVHGSLDQTDDGGGSIVDWNADPSSWFSGGGGGEEIDPVDNTPGYPVDHKKGLGISDYQEAWQKLVSKMSAAELTAFSVALAKAAADAKEMKEKGASDRLAQLAAAVLVGDSIGAAFASNQASDNLRGKSMALFEGFITKAYAVAAALPGGI